MDVGAIIEDSRSLKGNLYILLRGLYSAGMKFLVHLGDELPLTS